MSSLGKGGAERSSALLSKMLIGLGYDVHIVSILNYIDYEYAGTLLNLGELKDKNDTFFGRIQRFFVFKKYLKNEKFDLIIDSRTRPSIIKEFLLVQLLYKKHNMLYVARSWNFNNYFTKSGFWAKKIFKKHWHYVGVSKEISNKISTLYHLKNVTTIYNPIDVEQANSLAEQPIDFSGDYILFYGRLVDEVKNISLLFKAYKKSVLPSKNIKLLILGDGPDLDILQQKAKDSPIVFMSFMSNPFSYIKQAKFTCLTSRYEGFPRAVLESLAVGTPVVAVNCSGVREIIKNGDNGLLVKNNDSDELASAMNSFIFETKLYQTCKQNAKKSLGKFSVNAIAENWQELIESIT